MPQLERRRISPDGTTTAVVGVGGMRFPGVEQEVVTEVIRRAVGFGMDYVETSPGYGDSEEKIGRALAETGLRDKVLLSTKSSKRDGPSMRRDLEQSLGRFQTDRLDFYHMWFVNDRDNYERLRSPGGALEEAKKAQEEGLFDHLGITGHSSNDEMLEWIDSGDFETVTIYYNALDRKVAEVAEKAHEKGLGVVAMGPLKGGFLASNSTKISFLKDEHSRANAEGALRWLVSDPALSVAIVGFDDPEQVDAAFRSATAPPMLPEKRSEIAAGLDRFEGFKEGLCTHCNYCKGCAEDIKIPEILTLLGQYQVYGTRDFARRRYRRLKVKADACVECGECMPKCPQGLEIPQLLREAHSLFGGEG